MKKLSLSAALVMCVAIAPALAVMNEGEGELGIGYGSTDVDSSIGIDSAPHYTLRGGYAINDRFQIEGQWASASEDETILGIGVDTTMNLLMVNGLYNFHPRDHITPFVMVGLGMADLEVETLGVSVDDSSLAYQVGGGSRFFFGAEKRAAFRFDVSMVSEDTFDDSSTHTNVTAGFTWRLGN